MVRCAGNRFVEQDPGGRLIANILPFGVLQCEGQPTGKSFDRRPRGLDLEAINLDLAHIALLYDAIGQNLANREIAGRL